MIEQFWLFHCGFFRAPRGILVRNGGIDIARIPFLCAVAVHSERGPIVIDAPFGHEGPKNAGDIVGGFLKAMGQAFKDEWSIVPRIRQIGFRSSDVNDVLMTHLHWDHTGGMKELAHATFHVDELELEYAKGLTPFEATRQGFVLDDFRALDKRMQTFGAADASIEKGHDVFGDGSVEAIPLRGHSAGHVGYRCHLTDGRRIFFAGDAAFFVSQIETEEELGIFPRLAAGDFAETKRTLSRLRDFNRSDVADDVWLTAHDQKWLGKCYDGPIPLHE